MTWWPTSWRPGCGRAVTLWLVTSVPGSALPSSTAAAAPNMRSPACRRAASCATSIRIGSEPCPSASRARVLAAHRCRPGQHGDRRRPAARGDRQRRDCAGARRGDPRVGFDVVFPILHGPYGEDGTIQGLLELAGLPLCRRRGAGQRGRGWTREFAKKLMAADGLPIGDYLVPRPGAQLAGRRRAWLVLAFRCSSSRARGGSSIGVSP